MKVVLNNFYDESSGYLTKVQDHTGRCVDLTYKNGMLEKVALPLDIVYTVVRMEVTAELLRL